MDVFGGKRALLELMRRVLFSISRFLGQKVRYRVKKAFFLDVIHKKSMGWLGPTPITNHGFTALAQDQGAKGVLATLWPVADKSTGLFMQNLYRIRQSEKLTKAQALQKAQVMFIRGETETTVPQTDAKRAKVIYADKKAQKQEATFTPDPNAPYAHPFYWAPFILMGNWL